MRQQTAAVVLCCAATVLAQTVYLTGIIRNAADQPLPGAEVRLSKLGLGATSDASGRYVIRSGMVRSTASRTLAGHAWAVQGERLRLDLNSPAAVQVRLYDLHGRVARTLADERLAAGRHVLDLATAGPARQSLVLYVACEGVEGTYQLAGALPGPVAPAKAAAVFDANALTVLDTLKASSGASTVRLFVYAWVDTMDFWLLESDQYSEARQQCLHRINFYRGTVGMGPLTRRKDKESCVDVQAQSDAAANTAHGAFGRCGESAQNECPRYSSLSAVYTNCLQYMWDEGPPPPGDPCTYPSACYTAHGHYINMTNPAYTGAACGFYVGATTWGIQNFWR